MFPKKIVFIIIVLVVLLVIGGLLWFYVPRSGSSYGTPSPTFSPIPSGQVVEVPQGLIQCSPQYFERVGDRYKIDCAALPLAHVCSYYKVGDQSSGRVGRVEYPNECFACRYYDQNGKKVIAGVQYTHLGYQKGICGLKKTR